MGGLMMQDKNTIEYNLNYKIKKLMKIKNKGKIDGNNR